MFSSEWIKLIKLHYNNISSNILCPICRELLDDVVSTTCKHNFCKKCIMTVLDKNYKASCPICKNAFTKRSLISLPYYKPLISLVQKLEPILTGDITNGNLESKVNKDNENADFVNPKNGIGFPEFELSTKNHQSHVNLNANGTKTFESSLCKNKGKLSSVDQKDVISESKPTVRKQSSDMNPITNGTFALDDPTYKGKENVNENRRENPKEPVTKSVTKRRPLLSKDKTLRKTFDFNVNTEDLLEDKTDSFDLFGQIISKPAKLNFVINNELKAIKPVKETKNPPLSSHSHESIEKEIQIEPPRCPKEVIEIETTTSTQATQLMERDISTIVEEESYPNEQSHMCNNIPSTSSSSSNADKSSNKEAIIILPLSGGSLSCPCCKLVNTIEVIGDKIYIRRNVQANNKVLGDEMLKITSDSRISPIKEIENRITKADEKVAEPNQETELFFTEQNNESFMEEQKDELAIEEICLANKPTFNSDLKECEKETIAEQDAFKHQDFESAVKDGEVIAQENSSEEQINESDDVLGLFERLQQTILPLSQNQDNGIDEDSEEEIVSPTPNQKTLLSKSSIPSEVFLPSDPDLTFASQLVKPLLKISKEQAPARLNRKVSSQKGTSRLPSVSLGIKKERKKRKYTKIKALSSDSSDESDVNGIFEPISENCSKKQKLSEYPMVMEEPYSELLESQSQESLLKEIEDMKKRLDHMQELVQNSIEVKGDPLSDFSHVN